MINSKHLIIGVDKAQKDGKHTTKHNQILAMGHEIIMLPLPVGDYILVDDAVMEVIKRRGDKLKKMDLMGVTRRSVDTKNQMTETYQNLIGKSHPRFRDECILAQQNGIELTVLIESAPYVKKLEDVRSWIHWGQMRAYCRRNDIQIGTGMFERIDEYVAHGGQRPPVSGEQLYKAMKTMQESYGFRWDFCCPEETGMRIIELLTR